MALMTVKEAMYGGRMAAVTPDARQEQSARIMRLAQRGKLTFQTRGEGMDQDFRVLLTTGAKDKPAVPLCEIISRVCRDGSRAPHALPAVGGFSAEAWEQWWAEGGAALAAEKV